LFASLCTGMRPTLNRFTSWLCFRIPFLVQVIVLAQLRHVPPPERSGEPPVTGQQDVLHPAIIGQAHRTALAALQCEIEGGGVDLDASHVDLRVSQVDDVGGLVVAWGEPCNGLHE